MASPKELKLNDKIRQRLQGLPLQTFDLLVRDEEFAVLQEQANTVSIRRLGFNDHGPVHMRQVTLNALKMAQILHEAGTLLNLEKEETGTYEDSQIALILAGFLHDVGMSITRSHHEQTALWLVGSGIERILAQVYSQDLRRRIAVKTLVFEAILGHMATIPIHSLEAGIILAADGCDMEKGRARIPLFLHPQASVGDIHKYSSSAVEKVKILPGDQRPILIDIQMTETVGFHQVEEVLMPKIQASPIRGLVELRARVQDQEPQVYLR